MNNHISIQSIYDYPTKLLKTYETTNYKKFKQHYLLKKQFYNLLAKIGKLCNLSK